MWWFIGVAGADTKLHLILGNSDTVLERILVAHSSQLQFSLQCSFGCFLNSRWIEKLFGLDGFLSEEAVDEANEVIDLQKKEEKYMIVSFFSLKCCTSFIDIYDWQVTYASYIYKL